MEEKSDVKRWQVWKAIDHLQAAVKKHEYQTITDKVLEILRLWATAWAGHPQWQSLLNKRTFLHEVEESMVALYYLDQWRQQSCDDKFVAVDVCGGKGIFSMLLQYMAALYWTRNDGYCCLDHIILLEKATEIDWHHLFAEPANEALQNKLLVRVHLWDGCNLHHYDELIDRFRNQVRLPLTMTGIHLCKLLSPSMISLVNLLGDQCRYVCLAPCCMPRVVVSKRLQETQRCIQVYGYESLEQRNKRLELLERKRLRKVRNSGVCFLCQSADHWLYKCPQFADKPEKDKSQLLQAAAATRPCWRCGLVGHFQKNCPSDTNAWVGNCEPPVRTILVADVLESSHPLLTYCQLLEPAMEDHKLAIIQADLKNGDKHRAENWDSRRKSVFIVTTAT